MEVTVSKYLNVRAGAPSINAPIHSYLEPGHIVEIDGKLYRGDVYDGNNYWYRDHAGNYYWSGGISAPETPLGDIFSTPTQFIDFHCHSILKPYSKSFKRKKNRGKNSSNERRRYSIWFKRELNIFKKIANAILFGVTKFTQADFTSAFQGKARVLMVSIDPMERELVLSRGKDQPIFGGLILDLVQGIGKKRMKYLRELDNYFADLKASYSYLEMLQNDKKDLNGKTVSYKLVDLVEDIDFLATDTLHIIPTIEGGHVFRTNLDPELSKEDIEKQMLASIKEVKLGLGDNGSKVTPFFVSLAHHFKNGLCGQAASLASAKIAYKQDTDPDDGIFDLGEKVITALLSKTEGKRILIDVKHMNLKSRRAYYNHQLRKDENIPIIVSHGATNNKSWPTENTTEINFYKEEILIIARSGGIFGVQLDARRLREADYGSKRRGLKLTKKRKGLYKRAFFVWRQVEIMALLVYEENEKALDLEDIDPWGFQVIGSDFDGVVDPLDGFWTHSEMPLLREYLIEHAETFLRTKTASSLPDYDDLDAIVLVDKFLFYNAQDFLMEHFSADRR